MKQGCRIDIKLKRQNFIRDACAKVGWRSYQSIIWNTIDSYEMMCQQQSKSCVEKRMKSISTEKVKS